MRQDLLGVVVFVGCLFVAGVALAQDAPTPSPTATSSPTPSPTRTPGPILPSARAEVDRQRKLDATFMTRTQLRGLEEIELGRIAERASNNAVRSLARELAQERRKAHEALRLLAESHGVVLPTTLDAQRNAEIDRLSRLPAPDLDRAIVLALVRTHDADVADFQKQTQMAQEVELQAWVYDMLPFLEDHQEAIHGVAADLGIALPDAR